ncbi:MAG: TetR family transcriptional regulator [Actinobacteria bacterium]|nr:TetR family transcriptional regulator [Actinomycetota bacterium]
MERTTTTGQRTPNQESRRQEIIAAASSVVAAEGLAACTVRRIAEVTPLTKSTVHYYFDDVDELTDLVVVEVIRTFADLCTTILADADRRQSIVILTRIFIGREWGMYANASLLWHEFAVHSLQRGRHEGLAQTFALVADVFEEAVGDRSRALHNYLLGLNFRIRATSSDFAEIAADVSALTGINVTAADLS